MIIALDFETSGTDPNRHAPIQIGLALMDGETVKESTELLIGPPRHWKDKEKVTREYDIIAMKVTGIGWKDIIAADPAIEVCKTLDDFVYSNKADDFTVVAFNAPFDLAFWSTLMFLGGDWDPNTRGKWDTYPSPLIGPWHCALMLARRKLSLPDYKLDTVAAHFDLGRETDKHGALEDAILAGRVYHRLTGGQV